MIFIPYLPVKLFRETLLFNHIFFYLGTRQSALWRVVASSSKRDAMSFPCGTETKVYMIFSPAWRFFFAVGRSPSLCWGSTRFFTFICFLLNSPINWKISFKFAFISSLDYSDVQLTSSRKSRLGLRAFQVIIIKSDKSHIPEGWFDLGKLSRH